MLDVEAQAVVNPRRARSVAFALLARSLGSDPAPLHDQQHREALRAALADAGADRALEVLVAFEAREGSDPAGLPSPEVLAGRWVRWFDLGRVAPYEGSNVALSAGGVTPRLADISGYYRAFGLRVTDDRPDHVVAELEFLAFALLLEADAVERGDVEHAEVTTAAIASFLRDHAGCWVDAWAGRVAAVDELAPWAPLAAAAAELVRAEAARRDVVPRRTDRILVDDAGVEPDDEPDLSCG